MVVYSRDEAKQAVLKGIPCTRYLQKSKGRQYKCPFCGSGTGTHGTGALTYYPDTNTWTCFSCRKTGDVLDLMQQEQGVDFKTALEYGMQELGITVEAARRPPERPKSAQQAADDRKPMESPKAAENAPREATAADYTEYYRISWDRLADSPEALAYLEARGISKGTAAFYNIGYDPAADPASAPGAMEGEPTAHPAKRIIVPCTDDFYIARSIDPATPAAFKAPNPKGSSTKLFNAAALYNSEFVFVTEGIFDALSFIEIGFAAVATNGKGNGRLLAEQLQERPTRSKIIICHDNDTDPQTAADTMRQAEELNRTLQAMGADSIIYNVAGAYHDANEALQSNREEFTIAAQKAIQEAQRDSLTDFLESIQGDAYKPYKTGLSFFDDLLGGGMIRQTLLLLMAAPAAGKTTLAQQIAEAMAKNGKPVIYLNLEMSREQMLAKAISGRLTRKKGGIKVTALDVLQGYRWTPEQRQAITAEVEAYRKEIFPYLQYNPAGIGSDIGQISDYLEAAGQQATADGKEAPAVILDYLHLVTGGGSDVQELIKQTVTTLKGYAIKYNTFVIGIVATNRDSNKGGKITMESGRDSSSIEYTADVQLALNYYAVDKGEISTTDTEQMAQLQQEEWRQMIIRVLKGRFITPGRSARVYFHAAGNTFYGENDWLPADDMRTPFDQKPPADDQTEKRKRL